MMRPYLGFGDRVKIRNPDRPILCNAPGAPPTAKGGKERAIPTSIVVGKPSENEKPPKKAKSAPRALTETYFDCE